MKKQDFKIGIVGLGNMGKAIIESLLKSFPYFLIAGYDTITEKRAFIRSAYKISVKDEIDGLLDFSDIVVICVKPQDIKNLLEDIQKKIEGRRIVFVSIAAGVKISFIEKYVHKNSVIRVMPNLAAFIGESVNAYVCSKRCLVKDEIKVVKLLSSFGEPVKFKNEEDLDRVTALSGSGPAYVFYFFDALREAGKKIGLSEEKTLSLIRKMFVSSVHLLEREEFNAQSLIKRVASKKGTTEQALKVFKKHKFRNIVYRAVNRAYIRAKKLSREVSR